MNIKSLHAYLIVPDTHVPFEDRRAYNLMILVAQYLYEECGLKEVVFLGDFLDFYNVMSHKKDASIKVDFKHEIEYANERFDEFDVLFPESEKTFIEGNHEFRFERYINDKCPELFGITDWQMLTRMEQRKWRVVPYGPSQRYQVGESSLYGRHEPTPKNGDPLAVLRQTMCSLVYGHVHRIREGYAVSLNNEQHVAFCPGWLGNKDHQVMKYVNSHHQWQLGFAIVWVDPLTKLFYHQKIAILSDYTCMVNGRRFKI